MQTEKESDFTPLPWTLKEIRDAIPSHLFAQNTMLGMCYLVRDVLMAMTTLKAALLLDMLFRSDMAHTTLTPAWAEVARWLVLGIYWWFQGLIFTGLSALGHECGHGAIASSRTLCDIVGFAVHSFLFIPYFSWKLSHHKHHKYNGLMEKDDVVVPKTRSDLGIPKKPDDEIDWDDYFGDTPLYTLGMLIGHQLLGMQAYMIFYASGPKNYPRWTSHYDPNSVLFTKDQRTHVLLSNLGVLSMLYALKRACDTWGVVQVLKYYGVPWFLLNHWFVMISYLQHTDPVIPKYRGKAWNFPRGAAVTVDRDFLGWHGRFFLHGVAHYHVVHHFFPKLPFYHAKEATEHLKRFLGEHYVYSDKPIFKALWDNFNNCQFVEDEGMIVFFRDKRGRSIRQASTQFLEENE
ncbi:delta 12 fatty acid epoxygenase [Panus rudis PR-1116 ss-1]|nr:delta 12 fatty acid epoxygenase [Panus rudis PR-1116 ss-1]